MLIGTYSFIWQATSAKRKSSDLFGIRVKLIFLFYQHSHRRQGGSRPSPSHGLYLGKSEIIRALNLLS